MKGKVLIVDDTYQKIEPLVDVLRKYGSCEIETCVSVKGAVTRLRRSFYDLLITDLQIPIEEGEALSVNGGYELLSYCTVNENINRPTHIIGVTSHSEAYLEQLEYFVSQGWPLLLESEFDKYAASILQSKVRHFCPKPREFDVAFVAALYSPEFEALLELPCDWVEVDDDADSNTYYSGVISKDGCVDVNVVATVCPRMGMVSATATAVKICMKYKPNRVIMTGIAAGVEGKTNFGDILIADNCWDWGAGKLVEGEGKSVRQSAPNQHVIDSSVRKEIVSLCKDRELLDKILTGWPAGKRPSQTLNALLGPVASGAVVLADNSTVSEIVKQHREIIGVEMEAYGFLQGVQASDVPSVKAIVIKSVCDFASPQKNDDWQKYAAYTSSNFAYEYIRRQMKKIFDI